MKLRQIWIYSNKTLEFHINTQKYFSPHHQTSMAPTNQTWHLLHAIISLKYFLSNIFKYSFFYMFLSTKLLYWNYQPYSILFIISLLPWENVTERVCANTNGCWVLQTGVCVWAHSHTSAETGLSLIAILRLMLSLRMETLVLHNN